jgi:hypothetical protein
MDSAGFHAAPSRKARSPPLDQDVGRAHPSQIGHQRERIVVAHHDAIDIGDRQRKARALQQRADIAQIGKGCDARRHPAFAFGLGLRKSLPEFGERIADSQAVPVEQHRRLSDDSDSCRHVDLLLTAYLTPTATTISQGPSKPAFPSKAPSSCSISRHAASRPASSRLASI